MIPQTPCLRIPMSILADRQCSTAAKVFLAVLIHHADDQGIVRSKSLEELAAMTGRTGASIAGWRRELERLGYVSIIQRAGRGFGPNMYQLTAKALGLK